MDKQEILSFYDKILAVMELMVKAAEDGDWDSVATLEPQCSAYIDVLRSKDHHEGLTEEESSYKMNLIQKILDDDSRIQELMRHRMDELTDLIQHTATSRKVHRVYVGNHIVS